MGWLCIGGFLLCGLNASDLRELGRPAMRWYTDQDGLPQNTVESLVVDRSGYLWAGTQGGPARYNGKRWVSLPLPQDCTSAWVRCLTASQDGSMWIGLVHGGVLCLREGQWERFPVATGAPQGQINVIYESLTGEIYVGGTQGLFQRKGQKWGQIPLPPPPKNGKPRHIMSIQEMSRLDGSMELWVGTENGLGLLHDREWTWFERKDDTIDSDVRCLLTTREKTGSETLWIGTASGLFQWNGNAFRRFGTKEGVPQVTVNRITEAIAADGTRNIWLGTEAGLVLGQGDSWTTYGAKMGFPNLSVRSLLMYSPPGGKPTLWVGTFAGLVRVLPGGWLNFDRQGNLNETAVFSIQQSEDLSGFWFGTYGQGLVRFENGNWKRYGKDSYIPDRNVLSIAEVNSGPHKGLWMAMHAGGLLRATGGSSQRYKMDKGLPEDWVYSVKAFQSPGNETEIWAGTRIGPARMNQGRFEMPEGAKSLEWAPVIAMLETPGREGNRTYWFATRGRGLIRKEGDRWTQFRVLDGLCDDRVVSLCLKKETDGSAWLWMGTLHGLCRAKLGVDQLQFETIEVMRDVAVYSLALDAKGHFYAGTQQGVKRLTQTFSSDGKNAFKVQTFTISDGLPSSGCAEGAIFVDDKGCIWIGTLSGVSMLDPKAQVDDQIAKPLVIETLLTGGELNTNADHLKSGVTVSWRKPSIKIDFNLLSYFREEDTQYRSQMEGVESGATPWSSQSVREFPYLPAGNYRFKVWAKDFAGNESGPLLLNVKVERSPFWGPLAWFLYLSLFAGLLYFVRRRSFMALRHRERSLGLKLEHQKLEQEELEKNVMVLKEEVHRGHRSTSFFLTILRHEFRPQLSEIHSMAASMVENTEAEFQKEASESIQDITGNMLGIIREIIDYSEGETGEVDKVCFDPVVELEATLGAFAETASRKRLELIGHFDSELPERICGDLARLRQIIAYLLGHALHFTLEGEVRLRLGLHADTKVREGGFQPGEVVHCRLEVSDTGIGLSPEAIRDLFRLQEDRGDPPISEETLHGMGLDGFGEGGLGLAICHRIVSRMAGSLEVDTEVSSGTSFLCDIPFEVGPVPETSDTLGLQKMRIVLFEPNASLRHAIQSHCRRWGVEVFDAETLEDVSRIIEMPGLGRSLSGLILGLTPQESDPTPLYRRFERVGLPIGFLVGGSAGPMAERLKLEGKADYVPKPVRRARLHALLKALCPKMP